MTQSLGQPGPSPGFEPAYFKDLYTQEATHFWFRNRNQLICWAMGPYARQIRTFLEIGCGTGYVLNGIREAFPQIEQLYGGEFYAEGLVYAQKRLPNVTLLQMDACDIPYTHFFDAIGAFDVLEHIDADVMALQAIHKALVPGGMLFLTVPQHPWLWSGFDTHACHKRRYTRAEMLQKLESAGFQVEFITSFMMLLLPLVLLSRGIGSKSKSDPGANEMQPSPLLNKLLELVLRLEHLFIHQRCSLPIGSSLLVVAKAI